jgi:hypothetical protein
LLHFGLDKQFIKILNKTTGILVLLKGLGYARARAK